MATILAGEISVFRIGSTTISARILGGGWDYVANGLPEYLLLQSEGESAGSDLIYLELSASGESTVLWRRHFDNDRALLVEAAVTDLDGNGRREISALINHQSLPENASPQWLQVFDWDSGKAIFADEPSYSWSYRGRGISYLRPAGLIVSDLDSNGDDELIVITGSPDRMVLVVDHSRSGLQAKADLRPRNIITGSRPFTAIDADLNGDLRRDIVVVGQGEDQPISAFIDGRSSYREVTLTASTSQPILMDAIAAGDPDGDGQEEVLIAHNDGSLTRVYLSGPSLNSTRMDERITGLRHLSMADLNGDGRDEMLYLLDNGTVAATGGMSGTLLNIGTVRSVTGEGVSGPVEYEKFLILPGSPGRAPQLSLVAKTDQGLFLAAMPVGSPTPVAEPPVDYQAPGVTEIVEMEPGAKLPEMPLVSDQDRATAMEGIPDEGPVVFFPQRGGPPDPRALPPFRTPDYVLYSGDEFSRNVLGERADQFVNFRFLRKPPGMVFNFQRQAMVWQPGDEHFGAWNVEYEILFQTGVNYEDQVTDSAQVFRVIPETEQVKEQMLIYVNDKPRITSRPETERILAGQLFAYRIQVNDRNSDARLEYRLETSPENMVLDRNGILTWRTNETHHDDYQVVISAYDGFDKDVQTFTINVNAKLMLTSSAPHLARVKKPYEYQVTSFQPGTQKQYTYSLPKAPEGMTVDEQGIIHWTPGPDQLDTNEFQVRVTDGITEDVQDGWVFVNSPPRIVNPPMAAMTVMAGDTVQLGFSATDANRTSRQQWVVARGPLNMTIDSTGNVIWPTGYGNLDANKYVVEVSDGMDVTAFRGVIFVNSAIQITSVPPDSAIIGQTYNYQVASRDENTNALLKFRRPTVITDLERSSAYIIDVQDDKFRHELPRYIAQFKEARNVYINKPQRPDAGEVTEAARVDLKQAVKHLFIDGEQLVVVYISPQPGLVNLDDVLWELFQGGRGIMPKYEAKPIPFIHYSLSDFPDGMTVTHNGHISWDPAPSQAGYHQVRLVVSDGFTRDEQTFRVYANYPPAIISQPDTLADAEARFTYNIRVDDKNEEAKLTYRLTKAPEGMQVDAHGMVTWLPSLEQLNWQEFVVEASDGHAADRQAASIFVNMSPRIISQPKPVALNHYEYTYRVVAEDLNRDAIRYQAVKLPRYSEFDARTGLFKWRPRTLQKGPNDIIFEVTDSHGGITIHEFQVHVFEDPSRERFLFTSWPLLLAFAGTIFVLGITVGG